MGMSRDSTVVTSDGECRQQRGGWAKIQRNPNDLCSIHESSPVTIPIAEFGIRNLAFLFASRGPLRQNQRVRCRSMMPVARWLDNDERLRTYSVLLSPIVHNEFRSCSYYLPVPHYFPAIVRPPTDTVLQSDHGDS